MITWLLQKLKGDKIIWIIVFLLALISLLAVYSSVSAQAFRLAKGNTELYLLRQMFFLIVGFIVMYVVHLVNYRVFAKVTNLLLLLCIPLLVYTLFSGREVNEASRWISVAGQSFQPSDVAKLAIIMYLAKMLSLRQKVIKDFVEGFLPGIFWICVICGLIAPTNLSTALVIFTASLLVLFISGVELKYIGLLFLIGVLGLLMLLTFAKRSTTWKSRWRSYVAQLTTDEKALIELRKSMGKDAQFFQSFQSNVAVATGGFFGKGVGKSSQRENLPLAFSDFVFPIIIEEYGLLGGAILISLYLLLLFRTITVVTVSRTYGALMAAGLAFMMVMQALIHMGVTVGLLPVTGLTLPFVSMGGTSIVFTSIALGIILSVSRDAIERKLDNNMEVDPKNLIRT
ncbi:MAG: FtsW/RodA/SpoVE family cell cycle protein [Bacteroidia bacterium]